ncbi:hypothetical protein GCM10010413_36990 [Promicromonospora sukumoe]|uniref:Alkanesulfonate monooxygenase SsuD/methylene tetrahydromethanopterin reductase-like flavin-dependent oxidoreductase (Luciferase family) n=1 Tax=Promicromonospora sukumoe TaxID=88382 RepID=A0A7W3J7M2_9MICO|nr:LLM class flavin-dependent oxidoreductase [Promicromonospora sukumoe]MBA8807639.1 alkanesulfonate monooxygenase SsuD/methylene tetrahydromethanopterin reductase-like flavin-dependent oxidoreductase (luciferase family) [Promicromonospora sukumoe]
MNYAHSLELGLQLPQGAEVDDDARHRLVSLAEELGYDLVSVVDRPDLPATDAVTLLGWLAARTSTIRLSADIRALPLRDPAVLARSVASLDRLTSGRLDLVLGAETSADTVVAAGGPQLEKAETCGVLGEAIDVVRELWSMERGLARVDGRHYRLSGAAKAAPAHEVPVGVYGTTPDLLELAGRRADAWSARYAGTDALAASNATIDDAARQAGRAPREIRRRIIVNGTFIQAGEEHSLGLTATPTQWVTELLPLVVDHGVGTIMLDSVDTDTITRFAREVIPALRAAIDAALPYGSAGLRVRTAAALARRTPGIDYDDVPAGLAEIVEPGDRAYARYRSGYLRGGSPAVVLRVSTPEQVALALAYARRHPELPLPRRSAGHGISGRSTNEGGIVIDLSAMNQIEVLDEATRRVRIGPGARWMEVAAALHPYGWALSSGDYGGVGVGGLATAGGIGYLVRAHGLTIDHLRAVDMVLADGSLVQASETENTDLFWAVRGAGANVGIVTSFEFEADVVGPVGYAELTQDASDPARFLVDWGQFVETSPREVTSFLIMSPARGRQPAVALTRTMVDSDDPETVVARIEPLADLAALYAQQVQIVPYAAVLANASDEEPVSQGEPVSRSGLLRHITPEFAAAAARVLSSGGVHWFQIRALGGAVADTDPDATAFAHRDANFSVVVMGRQDSVVDRLWARLEPFFEGSYLSFDSSLRPDRIEQAWPTRTLARLRELKVAYDPDGVFNDNFHIPLVPSPASTGAAR